MRARLLALALVPFLAAAAATAQSAFDAPLPPIDDPTNGSPMAAPISVAYVEGRIDIARQDGLEEAIAPELLEDGDRLVVAEGRAELLLDDGSIAHVDRNSDLRVDGGARLRLVSGRLVLHVSRDTPELVVSTPAGTTRLIGGGRYDLGADDLRGETTVAVLEGRALVHAGGREMSVAAGDILSLDPRTRAERWARGFGHDAFVDWSTRRVERATAAAHAAPLPAPLRPWANDLALHGQWATLAPYGPVWFPATGASWQPYQRGSWRFTRYGWTWIDLDRWAWPVHHYGRWGHHPGRGWYWIPQRTWGPAWVGWATASSHVAWAPLGWNRRPIVEFAAGARVGPGGLFASSWSILPRGAFGRRGPIHRDLLDPRGLPGPVLGGFVSQMVGPRGPAARGDAFRVPTDYYSAPTRPASPTARRAPAGTAPAPPTAWQPRTSPAPARTAYPERPARRPTDAPPVDPAPPANGTGPGGGAPAGPPVATRPTDPTPAAPGWREVSPVERGGRGGSRGQGVEAGRTPVRRPTEGGGITTPAERRPSARPPQGGREGPSAGRGAPPGAGTRRGESGGEARRPAPVPGAVRRPR